MVLRPAWATPSPRATIALAAPTARPAVTVDAVRLAVRLLVLGAAVVTAFHVTLSTLRPGNLPAEYGFLVLPPALAVLLAVAVAAPRLGEPQVHDRQLDYIVGVPLLAASLVMLAWVPGYVGSAYWTGRIDVLALPVFISGAVSLVFGVRALWRLRAPLVVLTLLWPVPYWVVAGPAVSATDGWAAHVVRSLASVLNVPASGDLHTDVTARVEGVGSLVAVGLVALALALATAGRWTARVLFAAAAAAALAVLDVLTAVIAVAAAHLSTTAGRALLAPSAGLLVTGLGALAFFKLVPAFGLVPASALRVRATGRPRPVGRVSADPRRRRLAQLRPLLIVVEAALVASLAQEGLAQFHAVGDALGRPYLASFSTSGADIAGWSLHKTGTSPSLVSAPLALHDGSSWARYRYDLLGPAAGEPAAQAVEADVVTTTRPRPLQAQNAACCYRFDGYRLAHRHEVTLANGVAGYLFSYRGRVTELSKAALVWQWPVRSGSSLRFERVTLVSPPRRDPGAFLVTFARSLVTARMTHEQTHRAGAPSRRIEGVG